VKTRLAILVFILVLAGLGLVLILNNGLGTQAENPSFDGQRALGDVETQVNLGPRIGGSFAHAEFIQWLSSELEQAGWQVNIQQTTYQGKPIRNVIARRGTGSQWVVLGAHYDSRLRADRDPDPANQAAPVPGANDGASGVAVLVELARSLPQDTGQEIWLVFFDAEDNGRLDDWDWILGSRAFAESLQAKPNAVIIVDMVGDADLQLYWERNSHADLNNEIWQVAQELGYSQFIPEYKYSILDDHIPFVQLGIPAIDIIDIDYAYYHTTQDTTDKVSAQSLEAVGSTLLTWLVNRLEK
jgi:Zn-dependent M28 family amino/carboxypeptidase